MGPTIFLEGAPRMPDMKEQICEAFCGNLSVREVSTGFAIGTPYTNISGEPLGFYALGPDSDGCYRLMDDGTTIPLIEALGASLDSDTRFLAFTEILKEYHASYIDSERQVTIDNVSPNDLPGKSIQFIGLLLRIQDLLLMTRERVESSFREDALEKIRERFSGRAEIKENEPVSPDLSEVTPDMVVTAGKKQPVAIFIANTAQKISEALILHLLSMHQIKKPVRVVAVLDEEGSIPKKAEQRANNFLDAVPIFIGDGKEAIDRIEREVLGREEIMHQSVH
jgi:hypothetical protein